MASRCRHRDRGWLALALLCASLPGVHAQDMPVCPLTTTSTAPAGGYNNVRLVTGAPYSALGTSQTTITLPDGSRVVRENVIRQWRDSDGGTPAEFSLSTIGGTPPVEVNSTVTVIDDPGARMRYVLQPGGRVAVTMPIVPCRPATEPDLTVGPPRPANLPLHVSRPVKLGERRLDGETVAGRRIEATIPAGAIGNSRPIQMSAEQWYGKDLQVVVEATYRDPRTGETRYKLSDIDRTEPDASLFKVPKDLRKEAPQRGVRRTSP